MSRFWKLIISIGPAFFVVGYTIGTGSIVTMASAGSRYSMNLLWAVALSCIFLFVLIEAYGRFSLVTGQGSLYGVRKHIRGGKYIAIGILVGLIFIEVLSLTANMGILSSLISEWTGMLFGEKGWNTVWVAIVISLLVFLLFMIGKFSFFEKILIIFVSIMGLCFIITMFLVLPSPAEIARGLLLRIPEGANAPMIVAAIVGTTFSPPTFVVRSILMKEKKWGVGQLKHAKKDAIIGGIMMFIVSAAVMSCAAGTLYITNQPVDKVVTMVALLEPLLGRLAISIFVTGIIGAALSSLIPILMLGPMLISDYRDKPINYKSTFFRFFCGIVLLIGLTVPVFNADPVYVMLVSMVFQVFILPLVILTILYLLNRKDLMAQNKTGPLLNSALVVSFLFSLVISYQGIVGLIESFDKMF